jgi:hypothetical protein
MPDVKSIFDKKVRETAGPQTRARYDFQAHVAMLRIFDLHEKGNDYSVILDHFDDIVVVDRSERGEVLNFYQVKTKSSGQWTISALTKASGGNCPGSIIGKMYQNAAIFGDMTGSLSFLTNAGFDVRDVDGNRFPADAMRIPAQSLSQDARDKIEQVLDTDFPQPRNPQCCGILFLDRTPLGLSEQGTFVTGRLVEMLCEIGESDDLPIKAIYETIFANVSAKTRRSGVYSTDSEFYADKAVSRNEIEKVLAKAGAAARFRTWWPHLLSEGEKAGFGRIQLVKFENACLRYVRERAAGQFRANVSGKFLATQLPEALTEEDLGSSLIAYAQSLAASAAQRLDEDPESLLPIACVEILEHINGQS